MATNQKAGAPASAVKNAREQAFTTYMKTEPQVKPEIKPQAQAQTQPQHKLFHVPLRARASRPTLATHQDTGPPSPGLHTRHVEIPPRISPSSRHPPPPAGLLIHHYEQHSPATLTPMSATSSTDTYFTNATSVAANAAYQQKPTFPPDDLDQDQLTSFVEDDLRSFDLITLTGEEEYEVFSIEHRSQQLFSHEHLQVICADSAMLVQFMAFLNTYRLKSLPIFLYYLDSSKALKAVNFANAILHDLKAVEGCDFTSCALQVTTNTDLEDKNNQAFEVLVKEDLPAYIAHIYIQSVSASISKRVKGTLPAHLREASEGLAEVFCITDPSKPDNPIVFASKEFHLTTQYGVNYAIGRNCRFLQGAQTNPLSIKRLRDAIQNGKEHCEVLLNYHRDGSAFMNMLMIAPLRDGKGKVRYYIGAQVDVSNLVKEYTDMESLQRLVLQERRKRSSAEGAGIDEAEEKKDEFQELSEMLNSEELDTVRRFGGRMFARPDDAKDGSKGGTQRPRLRLKQSNTDFNLSSRLDQSASGLLTGVYQHYLLLRPNASLNVLYTSPSLAPVCQSSFMPHVVSAPRIRESLIAAFAEGRSVTAKIKWINSPRAASKDNEAHTAEDGRNKWIHCTPLYGSDGRIGVWMVVFVDDDSETDGEKERRWDRETAYGSSSSIKDFQVGEESRPASSKGSFDVASLYGSGKGKGAESVYSVRI